MSQKAKAPIIFVTGIGQTWTTLKNGKSKEKWNLIPRGKETIFEEFKLGDYASLVSFGLQAVFSAFTGAKLSDKASVNAISKLLRYCVADENGKLSDKLNVHIYGARSFDILRKTSFETNTITSKNERTLLQQVYHDIQCERYIGDYGEENLYCFNYSTFSNLYDNADLLHQMIKDVIKDQKNKTGSDKVILVPMSMGATVVNAYLDKYLSDENPADGCLVSKVISIVGAWNGSDGLADVLNFDIADDFDEKLLKILNGKARDMVLKIKPENLHKVGKTVLDAFVESILLRVSSFMALIPAERYDETAKVLFTPDRFKRISHLSKVKSEAERYHNAQVHLKERLEFLNKHHNIGIYFISGCGLKFGDENRDFSFLSMFKSVENDNTDAVIQISSTAPGATSVHPSRKLPADSLNLYLSPDLTVDASTCYFKDTSWFFIGQQHELGTNNTALKLAIDIATDDVKDIYGKYPQFNYKRNIAGVYELVEKAEQILKSNKISKEKADELADAINITKQMLDSINNNPDYDNQIIENLKSIV